MKEFIQKEKQFAVQSVIRNSHEQILERIHTEEKPFCCSKCDKKVTWVDILENHERIQTEEKPFCFSSVKRNSHGQIF